MKKKRTNSIVAVTVAKYATMFVEADTPEEAMSYAKEYCDNVPDDAFDDSGVYVDSCEAYTTEVEDWMDEIWVEGGETMNRDEYLEEIEED